MLIPRALLVLMVSMCLGLAACARRANVPPSASSSASSAELASPGGGGGPPGSGGRAYDTSTVETIRGQAVLVDQVAPKRGMSSGVHVMMSTRGGGTISVHLGPAWFLDSQELRIEPGDMLEVTGSRVTLDGAPVLIARRVVKGEDELVLRDEAGLPVWSAARGRGAPPATGGAGLPEGEGGMSVLNEAEQQALHDALDDEYRAWATYDQVILDFGPVRPFINIREAEARHIEALHTLFQRYGLEVPENSWPGRAPRFASTREACEAGVEAEVANAALYERLMRSTSRQDILAVFDSLQRASQEGHLPAFRRCAARGAGQGPRWE